MGITVDGCLADFKANGCMGIKVCELAENIMRVDAPGYPMLPERLRGEEPEELAVEFLLFMIDRDRARFGGSGHTSWDKVILADGRTDADMVAFTRTLVNNWLSSQFKLTAKGREWESLRKRLERARGADGCRLFVHRARPSSWGIAGGPVTPTCVATRDLEIVARRHTVTRLRAKNPDGGRGGNLGRKGEVENLAWDVLAAAEGVVEQGVLFGIISRRIVGAPIVTSVAPVSDYAPEGMGTQEFMDMALNMGNAREV